MPSPIEPNETLVLLQVDLAIGRRLYFVVKGLAPVDDVENNRYYYEQHSCPTNFIPAEAICLDGDMDPHGVFKFVRAIQLTQDYLDAVESNDEDFWLARAFPEIGANPGQCARA